jgi:kynurenine/2-aminoadipate aminotransferase
MLLDPFENSSLLVEAPTYSGSLAFLRPMDGVNLVGVATDQGGLVPEALEDILDGWDEEEETGRKKPRVLYTIPNGSNPTGGSLSEERRRKIYEIGEEEEVLSHTHTLFSLSHTHTPHTSLSPHTL